MVIYKITNQLNGKVYIGQTSKTIEERFKRHVYDSINNRIDTHFSRAIRKYGPENFIIEEIDTATTQDELNEKEVYWIHFFDSINQGYNETDSGLKSGGNTYKYKTDGEMSIIRQKLSDGKKGENNPNAVKVKCKNMKTQEEKFFGSMAEMQDFFGESNHAFISSRCQGRIKCLYKGEWAIAYADQDYIKFSVGKGSNRARKIHITNLKDNKEYDFDSYAQAERFFELNPKSLSGKAYRYKNEPYFIVRNQYKIEVLE